MFRVSHGPSGEKGESVTMGTQGPASLPESPCRQHPGPVLALARSCSGEIWEELLSQLEGILGSLCFCRFCPLMVELCTSRPKMHT